MVVSLMSVWLYVSNLFQENSRAILGRQSVRWHNQQKLNIWTCSFWDVKLTEPTTGINTINFLNRHVYWVNQLFLSPFSMSQSVNHYQRATAQWSHLRHRHMFKVAFTHWGMATTCQGSPSDPKWTPWNPCQLGSIPNHSTNKIVGIHLDLTPALTALYSSI